VTWQDHHIFYIGKAHGWREKATLEEVHDSALEGHSERDKRPLIRLLRECN
jgi:hypothetical protein